MLGVDLDVPEVQLERVGDITGLRKTGCQDVGKTGELGLNVLLALQKRMCAGELRERARVVAFRLPSWYVLSMSEAVSAFLEGQDDPE